MSNLSFGVTAVDSPPMFEDLNSLVNLLCQESTAQAKMTHRHSPILLKDVKHLFTHLWMPRYLPAGLDLERAEVTNPKNSYPDLAFSRVANDGRLVLAVESKGEYCQEYVPVQKPGCVLQLEVGNRKGYLVRGSWTVTTDREGNLVDAGWDEKTLLKLVLFDSEHAQVLTLMSTPSDFLPEDEIINIAESLEHSKSHRIWLPWIRGR